MRNLPKSRRCMRCLPVHKALEDKYANIRCLYIKALKQVFELKVANAKISRELEQLQKCKALDVTQVVIKDPNPQELCTANFEKYVEEITVEHKLLQVVLDLFTSGSHARKEHAHDTNPKWMRCSNMYKAYIMDAFIRARSAKTVGWTNLFLGVYMAFGNLSASCWQLLQRFCILPSREYVESWINSYQKNIQSHQSFLCYVFDNLSFKLHVTHVHTGNTTKMKHLLNRYVKQHNYAL